MTIDEAIKIQGDDVYNATFPVYTVAIRHQAAQLGIEALKAWQRCRRKGLVPLGWVLPGETEDKGVT